MNRQITLGLLSIFAVIALVGGVTFAAFSSTASNEGNTFGAGTLTLWINGDGGSASTDVFHLLTDKQPGYSITQALELKNNGTVDASSVKLVNIDLTPSPTPGSGVGNLGDKLTLVLWDDTDDSGTINNLEVAIRTAHLTDPLWSNQSLGFSTFTAGETRHLKAKLTFDSDADDTYQGTSATFNFNFQANQ